MARRDPVNATRMQHQHTFTKDGYRIRSFETDLTDYPALDPVDPPEPHRPWTLKEVAGGMIIGVPIGLMIMLNVAPWFWGALLLLAMLGLMAAGCAWI